MQLDVEVSPPACWMDSNRHRTSYIGLNVTTLPVISGIDALTPPGPLTSRLNFGQVTDIHTDHDA